MTSRRSFLKTSALATAGAFATPSLLSSCGSNAAAAPAAKEFLGLQTYSLFNELTDDVPAAIARVKAAGYTDLELAGYRDGNMANMPVADFKKLCDDNGLKITSTHMGTPSSYTTPEAEFTEAWKKAVDDHAMMGCKWIIDPTWPKIETPEQAKECCERFNLAGKICKEAGMQFGYHNHSNEFGKVVPESQKAEYAEVYEKNKFTNPVRRLKTLPGEIVEELFIQNTDPELVCFELDCFWAVMGYQDPCEWLRKYPERFRMLHIKDSWIIGASGLMNWENIFNTAKEIGIHDWFVEIEKNDPQNRPQFFAVEESAKYLASKDFVW